MRIAVDLRSLQTGYISGVETYAVNVLEQLIRLDSANEYVLFYNAFSGTPTHEALHFINSRTVSRRIPSKLLNAGFKFFDYPTFERLVGDFDLLFLPNANHFAIAPQTKLAVTVHDLSPFITPEFYDVRRSIWHRLLNFKKIITRANIIFAVSEYTKRDLVDTFKVSSEKIVVTPLGVNSNLFNPDLDITRLRAVRTTYAVPGEFILFLGTLEPRKNVIGLVQAFNALRGNAGLVIAGRPGWKYGALFREIERSPKRKLIRVLGFVEEHDKPYIVKLARVFAFPSFYEGFGLPVLEAMRVGTPVLSSQLTSIPELTGDSALLINPYNVKDIMHGLDLLLTDETLRTQLSDKAFARSQTFTWEKTSQLMQKAFQSL